MNFPHRNRSLNPLIALIALAVIIVLMALTIQFLSDAYQFVESVFQVSSRQAGQYVSAIAGR
jgi:choline-glycine betaine transporter